MQFVFNVLNDLLTERVAIFASAFLASQSISRRLVFNI